MSPDLPARSPWIPEKEPSTGSRIGGDWLKAFDANHIAPPLRGRFKMNEHSFILNWNVSLRKGVSRSGFWLAG
ncbi:MAG: hypothetical protein HRF46_06990 [Acidobacteriota bacterium]